MLFTDMNFIHDIQMWFLGLADILISINEKSNSWPETVYHLLAVPSQLVSHIFWIFGKNGFTLTSIFEALLEGSPHMEYVLIQGRERTDMVRLIVCCSLIGQGLKNLSQSVCQ